MATQPPMTNSLAAFEDRSDTPRTDAFIQTLPNIPLNEGPLRAAEAMSEYMRAFAEYARALERECARKVWPH